MLEETNKPGVLAESLAQTKEEIEDFMMELFNQEHAVECRMKALKDEAAKEKAEAEALGVAKGEVIGVAKGEVKGRTEAVLETIENMLTDGCGWDMIRRYVKVPDNLLPEITKVFPEYAKS